MSWTSVHGQACRRYVSRSDTGIRRIGFPCGEDLWPGSSVAARRRSWFVVPDRGLKSTAALSPGRRSRPRGIRAPAAPRPLEHAFLDVINIKKEFHFAGRFTELRNVGVEILLHLRGQVAEPQACH